MRVLSPESPDPALAHPGLPGYLAAITAHCPYLSPSMTRGLTTWSSVHADSSDRPELLALLVEAAERLRQRRRRDGHLVCINIAVHGPTDIPSARAVLDWPHWLARKLYAPVQVMVGKFWIGETEDDRHRRAIPPPPVSFLSLRHSVVTKDARFLHNLPGVAAQLDAATEDDHDVLMPVLGLPLTSDNVRANYQRLREAFPAEKKVRA